MLIKYIGIQYLISINDPEVNMVYNKKVFIRDIEIENKIRNSISNNLDYDSIFFTMTYIEFYNLFNLLKDNKEFSFNFYKKNNEKSNVQYYKNKKSKNNIKWFTLDINTLDLYLKNALLDSYIKSKKFSLASSLLSFDNNYRKVGNNYIKIKPNKLKEYTNSITINKIEYDTHCINSKLINLNMKIEPKKYQVEALKWMLCNYNSYSSFLLCDEMGLGKTLEILMLVFFTSNFTYDKILILSPATLIDNWINEIFKFFDNIKCSISKDISDNSNITILSYESARNNISTIRKFNYLYLILDEGQKIKNTKTILWQTLNNIESKFRIIATGTPIEK